MSDSIIEHLVRNLGYDAVSKALNSAQQLELLYSWRTWARPEQLPPPGNWLVWLLLAGRGYGKSRTGAEWCRMKAHALPNSHGALIAPTAADARDVMVKALISCSPPWEGLRYESSKRSLTWLNGSSATLYSAEEPDRLRGPQHSWAWVDEIATWPDPETVWDEGLMMGLRVGANPQVIVTTTPRPIDILKRMVDKHHNQAIGNVAITKGSTFDNVGNLSAEFIATMQDKYASTRLGRQEIYAEILDDVEGALWTHAMIDRTRVQASPPLRRVVVAVDPSGSAKKTADTAGIVVAGLGDCSCKGKIEQHAFVLEDLTGKFSPRDMGERAIAAYHRHKCDRLVAEDNFGGKIIEDLVALIDKRVAYRAVHASRGKLVRAEPVAALYEQGRVHHIGLFKELEDEQCSYAPLVSTESPGRMDALVWAITDLMLGMPNASFGDAPFKSPSWTFHNLDSDNASNFEDD
jgi:phage terminase large subunit-like protein